MYKTFFYKQNLFDTPQNRCVLLNGKKVRWGRGCFDRGGERRPQKPKYPGIYIFIILYSNFYTILLGNVNSYI